MDRNPSRPLSPHLSIWKWGPNMLVSILHRVTGGALSTIGGDRPRLVAAGRGRRSPMPTRPSLTQATRWYGIVILVGISWAFFQHMPFGAAPLRDGYRRRLSSCRRNKFWANMTIVGSVLLTAALWAWIWLGAQA